MKNQECFYLRKSQIEVLKSIIENYEKGFVICSCDIERVLKIERNVLDKTVKLQGTILV